MASAKKLVVTMDNPDEKKHVTKYEADDASVMSSAYISKAALKDIGSPAKVKITIEAV